MFWAALLGWLALFLVGVHYMPFEILPLLQTDPILFFAALVGLGAVFIAPLGYYIERSWI